jgi:hypothetical protein
MWFNIIKADVPTQDYIERIKAAKYKSEEDKRKIKEYEQSEAEKEEREKLIERLEAVTPNEGEGFAIHASKIRRYSDIKEFESFVEWAEKKYKRGAATRKSLELLNKVIESSDKVTVIKEPELYIGGITGTVEIEGESGHTYQYDFQNDIEIEKNIYFDSDEVAENLAYYESHYPNIEETRHIPMCLSADSDLPVGDNIAAMILGLLNDEKSSEKIRVIEKAIYGDDMINWSALQEYINEFMNDIDLTEFVIEKFEE